MSTYRTEVDITKKQFKAITTHSNYSESFKDV
jgi:hypothetical protein